MVKRIQVGREKCYIAFEKKRDIDGYARVDLFPSEKVELEDFHLEGRKIEFLGIRKLRNFLQLKSAIFYHTTKKPYLLKNLNLEISISHSQNYCALVYSENPIGLDIEELHERILKIQSRFVHDSEKSIFKEGDVVDLTKLWTMKEAMFKLNQKSGIDFKKEMLVDRNEGDVYFGKILIETNWQKVILHCFQYEKLILSVCRFARSDEY